MVRHQASHDAEERHCDVVSALEELLNRGPGGAVKYSFSLNKLSLDDFAEAEGKLVSGKL